MRAMKLIKQLALSALLVTAIQSYQVLSESQSWSSSSSAATDTPMITPSTTPTESPTQTPTLAPTDTPTITPSTAPTESPTSTPTPTPSATPVATEERHLERQGRPHPTPVSHPPKFTLVPAPAPPRPTPKSGEKHLKSDGEKPKARGPRALRGNGESGDSDSEVFTGVLPLDMQLF